MEDKLEVNVVTLDDNQEYMILEIIENYYYFTNIKNSDDFCIRKRIKDEFHYLEDEAEFKDALKLFNDKNNKSE